MIFLKKELNTRGKTRENIVTHDELCRRNQHLIGAWWTVNGAKNRADELISAMAVGTRQARTQA
jgi:hypothetical protein